MPISSGSASTSATDWSATSGDTYNATGFLPPSIATKKNGINLQAMTGDQILQALSYLATEGDSSWGNIRAQLVKTGAYTGTPNFNINWGNDDISAVKTFFTKLHNHNAIADQPSPVTNFVVMQQKLVKNDGIAAGAKAPVTVPASAELENAAQTAFQKTLMRDATPEEAKKFAKDFQDMILAYGDGKDITKTAKPFATPAAPIAFEQDGQPVTPKSAPIKPPALQQPLTSTTAAENFASNVSPTESSAAAAVNGLNEFLGMLKG